MTAYRQDIESHQGVLYFYKPPDIYLSAVSDFAANFFRSRRRVCLISNCVI